MSRYSTGPTFPSVYANAEEGKGDPGILVSCSTIEAAIFGDPHDPEKISGARGIKARRGCIFGLLIRAKDNEEKEGRRKCDVVMNGHPRLTLIILQSTGAPSELWKWFQKI